MSTVSLNQKVKKTQQPAPAPPGAEPRIFSVFMKSEDTVVVWEPCV